MPKLTAQDGFDGFRKAFGAGARYREYTPADEERLRDRVPEVMRTILNWSFGRTLTAKGFMVNSDLPPLVTNARASVGPLEWDEIPEVVN
jgi:hypothetical protein